VYRDVPEIHALGEIIRAETARRFDTEIAAAVGELMHEGDISDLATYSAFYRVFRDLRDARLLSALFAPFIEGWDLPRPRVIDAGYCRMVAPDLFDAARQRPDLFDPREFVRNEFEAMPHGSSWGHAHRDVDARHYHFQTNIWFPLHDLDAKRTLLIFPESYRRDVGQYGVLPDPDKPHDWGFGEPLQIPLKFGDMLLFHSQQLHASPSQSRQRSRFTVEMRIAAACIDDNAEVYRRLFWNAANFKPATPSEPELTGGQLAEAPLPQFDVDFALAGLTAHAVVHRLFRDPDSSLLAGYLHREESVLDAAFSLEPDTWSRILQRLDELPCGEDLLLLVARLLLRQRRKDLAADVLRKVHAQSNSYFWAMEAGRIAGVAGLYEFAETAFTQAADLAEASDIALDRFATGMARPRSKRILQLLPGPASQAARVFARRARWRGGWSRYPPTYDHRPYWEGTTSLWRCRLRNGLDMFGLLDKVRQVQRLIYKVDRRAP
jgi:tetratricopeptide (TPR) repeat protein